MQTTICGKLFPNSRQARILDELMRHQSACIRFAYKRICDEKTQSEIEASLKSFFPQLNSLYRRCGYFRAIDAFKAAIFRVKSGQLETPSKVIFGGRRNLISLKKGQLSKSEWRAIRNNPLYSRGEKAKKGNLNLRFE